MVTNIKKDNIKVGYITQDEFDKQMKWTAEDAREYIKLAIKFYKKDGDYAMFLHCVMRAVKWVGVTKVARAVGMSRQGIYDALDRENANPGFQTLASILKVLGIDTTFVVREPLTNTTRTTSRNARSYAAQ